VLRRAELICPVLPLTRSDRPHMAVTSGKRRKMLASRVIHILSPTVNENSASKSEDLGALSGALEFAAIKARKAEAYGGG